MADALRPGGLYKVGDAFVDAEGKTVDAKEAKSALAKRAGETEEPQSSAATNAGGLAEDFPAREALVGGGFDTPEKVKAASDDDLLALDGVGPATLTKIREA